MAKTTPMIRYSLKDRGRKHTGQPRNFNVKALYDSINGAVCQETVASRGMIGYYGHLPRIRFGMMPTEGGVDGGKYVPVEPAFVTTHLKASPDGVIEHKAEFLDTAAGALAAKLFDNQVGGFSSAIDQRNNQFFGFDYVVQPNFLDNSFRGVSLDDVMGGNISQLTYDDIYVAELNEQQQSMIVLLDSINAERNAANETIERLQQENEQLLSMLASKGIEPSSVLDSVAIMPVVIDVDEAEKMRRDVSMFHTAELPRVIDKEAAKEDPFYNRMFNRIKR